MGPPQLLGLSGPHVCGVGGHGEQPKVAGGVLGWRFGVDGGGKGDVLAGGDRVSRRQPTRRSAGVCLQGQKYTRDIVLPPKEELQV